MLIVIIIIIIIIIIITIIITGLLHLLHLPHLVWELHPPQCLPCHRRRLPGPGPGDDRTGGEGEGNEGQGGAEIFVKFFATNIHKYCDKYQVW